MITSCYSRSDVMLYTAYTQHEDDGDNTHQSIKNNVQFKMGSNYKYNQNKSMGIRLLGGRMRGTSLDDIT